MAPEESAEEPEREAQAEARRRREPGEAPPEGSQAYSPRPSLERPARGWRGRGPLAAALIFLLAIVGLGLGLHRNAVGVAGDGLRLWVSDPSGDHGDVAEVRVDGELFQRVELKRTPPTLVIPASRGRAPVIEIVVVDDKGDGAQVRVAAEAELYTWLGGMRQVSAETWARDEEHPQPTRLFGLKSFDEPHARTGFKKTFSPDPERMKARGMAP